MQPTPQPDVHVDNVERVIAQTAPPTKDLWTVRIVVIALGLIVGLIIGVEGYLVAAFDRHLPDVLIGLGAVAVGALASILASTNTSRQ